MKPLVKTLEFETKVGLVIIQEYAENEYGFEFKSGYANGLYSPEPFKTFDAAYKAVKKHVARELKNQKYE